MKGKQRYNNNKGQKERNLIEREAGKRIKGREISDGLELF